MVLVLSLIALVLVIGLSVRDDFRDLRRVQEDARRDRLIRAAERELRRLGDRP
jgi:heme exporter protein D